MVSKDRCFGFLPMASGAAVMGVLQAVIVVLLLSTTGVLLDRWHAWRSEYETYRVKDTSVTTASTTATTGTGLPLVPTFTPFTTTTQIAHPAVFAVWQDEGIWYRDSSLSAFLEIHLAHHVALYALWLVCLFVFALAFRYRRASLVLPNLIMQVVGLVLMMILAGIVIAKLVLLNYQYNGIATPQDGVNNYPGRSWERDDINMRYAFYAVLLGILVIALVAEVVFIWIAIDFYKYLRDRQNTVHPGEEHIRTSYHHHYPEHTLLRDEQDPKHHLVQKQEVVPTRTTVLEPTTRVAYTSRDLVA